MDLRGKSEVRTWQKADTYNIFRYHQFPNCNVVPPPLHIRLCIVDKLVEIFNRAAHVQDRKLFWTNNSSNQSRGPWTELCASCSVKEGIRSEKYYSGKLSGVPCNKFMKQINAWCDQCFGTDILMYGTSLSMIPSLNDIEKGLR